MTLQHVVYGVALLLILGGAPDEAMAQLAGPGWALTQVPESAGFFRLDTRADGPWIVVALEQTRQILYRFDPVTGIRRPYARQYGAGPSAMITTVNDLVELGTEGVFFLEPNQQTWFRAQDVNGDGDALDMDTDPPEVRAMAVPGAFSNPTALVRRDDQRLWLANSTGQIWEQNLVATPRSRQVASGFGIIRGMAFHPVSGQAYVGGEAGGIGQLWRLLGDDNGNGLIEADNPREAVPMVASGAPISDIVFDASGNLAVARTDGLVHLWRDTNQDQIPDSPSLAADVLAPISGLAIAGTGPGLTPARAGGQQLLLGLGPTNQLTYRVTGYSVADLNGDGRVGPADILLWMNLFRQARQP